MRVLVVDEDSAVRREVIDRLEQESFAVWTASTAVIALEQLAVATFDIVVLSLELPEDAGRQILETVREIKGPIHVIAVSGAVAEHDRLEALEHGADDYVVRPFFVRELAARLVAVRRHQIHARDTVLDHGPLRIDLTSRAATLDDITLDLTPLEFTLLAFLAARPGHAFNREELLRAVWRSSATWQRESTVTEHVRTLRAKIERDPSHPRLLLTVRGVGYRFDPPSTDRPFPAAEVADVEPPEPLEGMFVAVDAARASGAALRHIITGVVSEVSDAVIVTDLDSRIHCWNGAAERLYGWAEHEVLSRRTRDVLRFSESDGTISAARHALDEGGRWFGELSLTARDGSPVTVWCSSATIHDDEGQPVLIAAVHRPVISARSPMAAAIATDETEIRQGLAHNDFVARYEPIVALESGIVAGIEASVAWNHPERGLVDLATSVDAGEHIGAVLEIERVTRIAACLQAASWRQSGFDVDLAVQMTNAQLSHPGLFTEITDALATADLPPDALWLEITETALVEDIENAVVLLHRFGALGVRVAVDNFGIGWGSLTHIKDLPVHALKIDKHFVHGVDCDHRDQAIAQSVVRLGQELGLTVVAVGVQTAAQDAALRAWGCAFGQGPFYGVPAPAELLSFQGASRGSEPEDVES